MIPIVAVADKYVNFYYEVGKEVPFYVVGGEMDGDKTARNSLMLDRWLTGSGYNITVAEFLGRGHEHFADEILRLFDWMGRLKRNFARKEIVGRSMRPWDSFYWWLDLARLPGQGDGRPRRLAAGTWRPRGEHRRQDHRDQRGACDHGRRADHDLALPRTG